MEIKKENYRVDFEATSEELFKVLGGRRLPMSSLKISGISTDSRQIRKGDIFFAIKGNKNDGHDYIEKAFASGASLCVFENGDERADGIKVNSVVRALGELAKYHRKTLKGKVVAITGSNGKTTTKNITASLLSCMGKTVKSNASFNNNIGLPLSILSAPRDVDYLVLELGMNHEGEIRELASICRPDVGVITNVGPVHLEFLKDIASVARAKTELFSSMGNDSVAVINEDDELISGLSTDIKAGKFSFSLKNREADLFLNYKENIADDITELDIHYSKDNFSAVLPFVGEHNVYNCAAAVSVALLLGSSRENIKKGLLQVAGENKRFEKIHLGNLTLINDCYNANPASTLAAFRSIRKIPGRRYLVLGDMLELGAQSRKYHEEIGSEACSCGFERIFLLGEMAGFVAKGINNSCKSSQRISVFENHQSLAKELIEELKSQSEKLTVLVKGSRGMQMEKISDKLIEKFKEGN